MKVEFYTSGNRIFVVTANGIRLKSHPRDQMISQEEFDNLEKTKISKRKYLEVINSFYNKIQAEWEFQGEKFRKLENFNLSPDDILGHFNGIQFGECTILFHKGKLYKSAGMSGNYFPQITLNDLYTNQFVKWTNVKNVAPVFNLSKGKVV